jgi:sulfite reductase (ferredoxin)
MQSFRTELENPIVEQDILDLEKKIRQFREGTLDSEKFRSLRLARGVYGQRQQGVQMIRIKLPYGRMTVQQMLKISDVSDEYAIRNLHLTTRQDIQIHYVSLERTPELWAKLEESNVTLREACGNTVRNITGSPAAGIDPNELFDISPYAHEMFKYFLRNPICQEMGRKFKIAFSSSDADSGLTFMHDLGFIPRVKTVDGKEVRGFKVMIGGGLGAQPMLAKLGYEFLEEDQIIPLTEAVLRVFDRYGERTRRMKARMKYLINDLGLEAFMDLVEKEKKAIKSSSYKIDRNCVPDAGPASEKAVPAYEIKDQAKYEAWYKTNVFEQKQKGFYGVYMRVLTGDLSTEKARLLAPLVTNYAADDIRITPNQGILFKYIRKEALPYFFTELEKLGLEDAGFDSTADITACPGTDTCNLGISSSTGAARIFEKVIAEEYPELIYNNDIKIKISGCMNSCGQHSMATIGFHGSSIKNGANVLPALQLILGGGILGGGEGSVAEKVIKFPSKRGPAVLRTLLDDYDHSSNDGEYFNTYYKRKGKDYFYQLLKHHADLTTIVANDYIDWDTEEKYQTLVGLGECAGVMIDLVATLIFEAEEKFDWAKKALAEKSYVDAIYYTYITMVSGAKALLLSKQVTCNTHIGIIKDFDKHFVSTDDFKFAGTFEDFVLKMNKQEASEAYANQYFNECKHFLSMINEYRNKHAEVKLPESVIKTLETQTESEG